MKCPKCSQPRVQGPECPHCGIVYQKYAQAQQRPLLVAPADKTPAGHHKKAELKNYLFFGIAICLLGALIYLFASQDKPPAPIPPSADSAKTANEEKTPGPDTIIALTQQASPARNPVEKARNATVFIKTNFGSGSGFFVDGACHIITNRHVVRVSEENMAQYEFEHKQLSQQIQQFESAIRAQVNLYQMQGVQIDWDNPPPQITMMLQAHYQAKTRHEELGLILDGAHNQGTTVEAILVDGHTYEAEVIYISDAHDLALLQIADNECPYLLPDSAKKLQYGQKLYTIGNPEGLKHSVTAGVLSGHRSIGEEEFIQTDAPINPGNSGGPLINEAGYVIGINTARHADAEGIGFAIPIETALEVFSEILAVK